MMISDKIISRIPVRIGSAIIDQISLAFTVVFLSIPNFGYQLAKVLPIAYQEYNSIAVFDSIIFFSIFLNKDIYFGRSIGKYLTGLRVVSVKTGNPASPIQCSVRNLFLLVWPLEAIFLIFSPARRIGDIIAGTRVQESEVISHERRWHLIPAIVSVVVSFIVIFILFTFIDSLGIMN